MSVSRADVFSEQAAAHFSDPASASRLFVPNFARNAIGSNSAGFEHDSADEAFPDVEPGYRPLGSMVLVQFRQPKLRSAAGLILSESDRRTELDNTQTAKVIAVGPLAFHKRDSEALTPWPEGAWCKAGDYVRVPKYQGDYAQIAYTRTDYEIDDRTGKRVESQVDDRVLFAQFKDLAILSIYPNVEAALAAKAFL